MRLPAELYKYLKFQIIFILVKADEPTTVVAVIIIIKILLTIIYH